MSHFQWTDQAIECLAHIYHHIAQDSPQNAETFLEKLCDSVEMQLSVSLTIGRITPEIGNPLNREILYRNYRILYYIGDDGNKAYITQVQHGAKPLDI